MLSLTWGEASPVLEFSYVTRVAPNKRSVQATLVVTWIASRRLSTSDSSDEEHSFLIQEITVSVTFAGGEIVSNTSLRVSHRAGQQIKIINFLESFWLFKDAHSNWGAEDPQLPEFVAVTVSGCYYDGWKEKELYLQNIKILLPKHDKESYFGLRISRDVSRQFPISYCSEMIQSSTLVKATNHKGRLLWKCRAQTIRGPGCLAQDALRATLTCRMCFWNNVCSPWANFK